jgi:osmoprotectant transport system substrate-binding protein
VHLSRTLPGAAVLALVVALLAGCGADEPRRTAGSVTIGSADFAESQLLSEIYAGALRAQGFDVTLKHGLGPREEYLPDVEAGKVDVVPEYAGNLLGHYAPTSPARSAADVLAALPAALPKGLVVLTASAAENRDSYNVTAIAAREYHLKTIGDLTHLATHSPDHTVTLGGPAELQTRPYGVPGLTATYGITPIRFTALAPTPAGEQPPAVDALTGGRVEVAVLDSTSPWIPWLHLFTLRDPQHLVADQNVVPLVRRKKASSALRSALDAVSARLTTGDLQVLDSRIEGPQPASPAKVAQEWLAAQHLAE